MYFFIDCLYKNGRFLSFDLFYVYLVDFHDLQLLITMCLDQMIDLMLKLFAFFFLIYWNICDREYGNINLKTTVVIYIFTHVFGSILNIWIRV